MSHRVRHPHDAKRSLSMSGRNATHAALRSGTALPVGKAVMLRSQAVFDTREHALSTAADADLAVDRADVRLHGVGAQVREPCDVGVALALGDECQNLGFTIAEAFAASWPVEAGGAAR